jgi:hypothetical protein
MSVLSWRQFPFFESTPIKDPNYGSESSALYSDITLSAICSTDKYIAIATNENIVKLINSQIEKVIEFQCYEVGWTIIRLSYFQKSFKNVNYSCLVTIAERQGYPISLKLWNLDKLLDPNYNMKKFDFNSSFQSQCSITNATNNYPMTCFAHSSDYSTLTFGFSDGTVILVRGDLIHDRGSRQRVIYSSKEPITSINFRDDLTLYVTTISKVFTLSTTGRNNLNFDKLLDNKEGADIDCTDVLKENNFFNLLVAREENFQFYNSKGKSHSIQMNIPKKKIYVYQNRYILCLTYLNSKPTDSSVFSNNKLMILDTKNSFIVFNQSISQSITDIFEIWGDLYLLLSDGSLLKFHAKPFKDNIQVLVNNDLYQIALKLVNENLSEFTDLELMTLQKKYGFYLFDKGEFGASMDQFIKCITLGKTSEIISKFKESSKIQYLILYLEKLVDLKISTINHVNLLLTSYCKLKKNTDFENFINNIKIDDDFDIIEKHKNFDLDKIIQLCKENEYYNLALIIAQRFNLSSKVISIQLNDLKDPILTINYIESLTIENLLRVLIDNLNQLLDFLPNETTQLLIDVFTGKYKPKSRDLEIKNEIETKSISSYPLLTSYKQFASFMNSIHEADSQSSNTEDSEKEQNDNEPSTYQPPKPRIIFSSFVNHNYEFVIFLEACIESYDKFGGNVHDKNDIMNTLYEMYLTLAKEDENPDNIKDWEEKAKELLYQKSNLSEEDKNTLLLISNMYDFNDGEMIIRESTELNKENSSIDGFELDLFRLAVFSRNLQKSYDIVIKYGPKEPELYRLALITYTSNDECLEALGDNKLKELLEIIEKMKVLTPLEVLDCLTNGKANVKLGLIKDYLLRNIEKQKSEIKNNENLMDAYELKLKGLTSQINELLNDPKLFNSTKCSVCSNQLDFPIVYFKCGHQVHESCLIETNNINNSIISTTSNISIDDTNDGYIVCPVCSSDQDALMMLKKQQEEFALRQDLFKSTLEGSTDKFKTMFAFLGCGGMESGKVITDGTIV